MAILKEIKEIMRPQTKYSAFCNECKKNHVKICLTAMIIGLLIVSGTEPVFAQHTIEGEVIDGKTGKPLVAATVQLLEINRATVTNRNGIFRFVNIAEGSYTIRISFIGHATETRTIQLSGDDNEPLRFTLEEEPFEFDELVVTASPTRSAIQYQPAQALNQEQLQRRSASSIGEMLDGEPGVSMRYMGPATSRPVIRGFDGERVLILQNSERMGDLAGASADHGIAIEPLSARRIEIVRGPASLLYGTNALGGVVNIFSDEIPRQWVQRLSGNLALQSLSMNGSGAGLADLTYGLDEWAFTGRFSYRDAGNVRTPDRRIPNTYSENLTMGLGAGFDRGNTKGGLSFNFMDQTYGIPEELDNPDEEIEIQTGRENLQGWFEWDTEGFIQNVEWRFSATRYSLKEFEFEFEDGVLDEFELGLDFLQHNLSSTVTFQHRPFSIFNEGAFGINTNLRFLEVGGEEAFTPSGRSLFVALFAFEEVPLSEHFRLQAGTRLEYQNIEERPNELFPGAGSSTSKITFSGSFGIHFSPVEPLEIGAQLARAQRLPSFDELYAEGPHVALGSYDIGNPELNNEVSHGMDAFVKYKTGLLALELSGFYSRISNFIFRQPTGQTDPGSSFPVVEIQQNKAELYGGEMAALLIPVAGLHLHGSLDYVRGSRFNDRTTPLPFIPPLSSRFGVRYQTHSWWVGGNARLVSSKERVAPGEEITSDYQLVNLEAGYRLHSNGEHIVSLRMDNLFNVTYRDHLNRIEDRNFPQPARSVGATYRWIF